MKKKYFRVGITDSFESSGVRMLYNHLHKMKYKKTAAIRMLLGRALILWKQRDPGIEFWLGPYRKEEFDEWVKLSFEERLKAFSQS